MLRVPPLPLRRAGTRPRGWPPGDASSSWCRQGRWSPGQVRGRSVPAQSRPGSFGPRRNCARRCRALREGLPPTTKGKNYADPCPLVLPQLLRQAVDVWPIPTEAAAHEVGRLLPEALPPCRPAGTGVVAERRLQGRVLHPARHRPQGNALGKTGTREMKFRPGSCHLSRPFLTLPFPLFFFFFFLVN